MTFSAACKAVPSCVFSLRGSMTGNKTSEHPADLATNSHGTGFAGYANNAKIPVTGTAMIEVEDDARVEPTAEMIRPA
jgi:hypothetical protein